VREQSEPYLAPSKAPHVVDASVAVQWFVEQPQSAAADDVIQQGIRLVAPAFLRVELASALLRFRRRGSLSTEVVMESLDRVMNGLVSFRDDGLLLEQAVLIALDHGGSTYDALYVALAKLERLPLMTCDRQMAATATAARVKVRLVI
jgi:predicted nucleic acid-binding protein